MSRELGVFSERESAVVDLATDLGYVRSHGMCTPPQDNLLRLQPEVDVTAVSYRLFPPLA
jgi:hypothetical protein